MLKFQLEIKELFFNPHKISSVKPSIENSNCFKTAATLSGDVDSNNIMKLSMNTVNSQFAQ